LVQQLQEQIKTQEQQAIDLRQKEIQALRETLQQEMQQLSDRLEQLETGNPVPQGNPLVRPSPQPNPQAQSSLQLNPWVSPSPDNSLKPR